MNLCPFCHRETCRRIDWTIVAAWAGLIVLGAVLAVVAYVLATDLGAEVVAVLDRGLSAIGG